MPARCSLRSATLAERKKLRSPRGLAMWSGRPSIQPRMSASRPANRSGGAIGAGDPALEVGEGPASERALFCQRLLRAAQALSAFALDRVRERWKEAEIDVHRLVRARAGRFGAGGGFHMAAGDMSEQ